MERGTPRNPLAPVQHNGTRIIDTLVVSPRMAELHTLMPPQGAATLRALSPMPGLLVDVAVALARRCRPANAWRSSRP